MTAPNFTRSLLNSLTFSPTPLFSPSATRLFLLAGTDDIKPVICGCRLCSSSFLSDKHFAFQRAKRQRHEPLKTTCDTLALRRSTCQSPESRRPQTALTQIRCSLANTRATRLLPPRRRALRGVPFVRRRTEGRLQGGRVTEWAPSRGCRGYDRSRAVVWGLCALPSPAVTSDLVHSEVVGGAITGAEKKRSGKLRRQRSWQEGRGKSLPP